jgi:hypothetical protein
MKSSLLVILLTAIPALAADTLSGKWVIHQSVAGNESNVSCTFTQTGEELTGSCAFPTGAVKVSGKVTEKKVAWTIESEYNGSPLTLKYTGTLESATKMSGSVYVDPYGVDGEFSASPEK